MALPLLNSAPKYELTIPSTKEKIRFRPFLVKEQKVLLLAYETQDKKQVIQSILDTVEACIGEEVNIRSLTTFDIDYIFTQIRGKSVGEKVELGVPCKSCETPNDVDVNLENIEINVDEQEKIVQINDDISIKLRYPDYYTLISNEKFFNTESSAEIMLEVLYSCIESIMTQQENILVKDEPKEEVVKFVESMTSEQFNKITEFVQEIPTMQHKISFNCISCGTENERVLRGLDDFF